ncbi:MAG: 4Fe-4S dicluster domain-containing protein [Gaiellaceae bacterium]
MLLLNPEKGSPLSSATPTSERVASVVIAPEGLEALVEGLRSRGMRVVAPIARDGVIAYAEIASALELPVGWTDKQAPASYRLERRSDEARFGYAVGPHSWKQELFPSRLTLWKGARTEGSFQTEAAATPEQRTAFVGVRPCELAAIRIQDRVFTGGSYVDRDYLARRSNAFLVAVNCGEPGANCFCASMGSGPSATAGYDIALTEILASPGGGEHRFLVEAASEEGAAIVAELPSKPSTDADLAAARAVVDRAAEAMGDGLDTEGLHDLLLGNLEHPRFQEVAARCLNCTNCTLVCPTCFCSNVEDANDLSVGEVERIRTWDSCFSVKYSEMHGGATRQSGHSRYRQWLVHKLATWHDQFGSSGCVGCGRCITWCPVGIDLREEVDAIRSTQEGTA